MFISAVWPVVFTAELYAVAAVAGAAMMVMGNAVFPRSTPGATLGGVVCVALRLMSVRQGWRSFLSRNNRINRLHRRAQRDLEPGSGTSVVIRKVLSFQQAC
jgi:hypothetical protein